MLSHTCLIQASSCSTVLGLLCRSSSLWCAKCFLWVKDLDCRSISYRILLLRKPWCCNWCSMWSGIVMLENARSSLKETMSGWEHMFVLELGYTFQHWWWPFQMCKLAHATRTHATPYHQRCRLLNWALITTWVVLVLFSRMTWRPSFPKRTSNFDSSDHRTVFPLCHSPF